MGDEIGFLRPDSANDRIRRTRVLDQVQMWLDTPQGPPVLALVGAPGTGKSELLLQVQEHLDALNWPVGAAVLRLPSNLGTTTAAILIDELIDYCRTVDQDDTDARLAALPDAAVNQTLNIVIEHNTVDDVIIHQEAHTKDPTWELYERVVSKVLAPAKRDDGRPTIVIADGLDDDASAGSVAAFVTRLLHGRSALGLRWIVATRPEHWTDEPDYEAVTVIDLAREDTRESITAYLTLQLDRTPAASMISAASEVADGCFLVARYLATELRDDPTADPYTFVDGDGSPLANYYVNALSRLTRRADADGEAINLLLTQVAAAGPQGVTQPELQALTQLERNAIPKLLTTSRSLLRLLPDDRWACYHQSLAEFMLSEERSSMQKNRASDAHLAAAQWSVSADVFNELDPDQRLRIPWHLSRSVALVAPGTARTARRKVAAGVAWQLFHDREWASNARQHAVSQDVCEAARGVLSDIERLDPTPGPLTIQTRLHLTRILIECAATEDAYRECRNLLKLVTTVSNPDNRATLSTRHNLALAIGDNGDREHAIQLFTELLEDSARVLGPDDPYTLNTRDWLAIQLVRAGRNAEAIPHFEAVLAIRIVDPGPDNRATLTTRHNLALAIGDNGDREHAIQLFTELLEDSARVLGPDDPYTLNTRHSLATQLVRAGRNAEAIPHFEAVLAIRIVDPGPDNRATLSTRHNLALAIGDNGDREHAIQLFTELLEDSARVLGPDDPYTLNTRSSLATQLRRVGRQEDADAVEGT
ncbi:Tetratricopeptide repeat/AAA ATPase domain [Actinobacteria bacterium IMCC26256]|nr:Tetratricopeptide repeat/AAA ATPase domain [Actinobacteria bacterium IMCC26256]